LSKLLPQGLASILFANNHVARLSPGNREVYSGVIEGVS
jgi:hypothetical protein